MTRLVLVILGLLFLAWVPLQRSEQAISVGSKKFTESVILGEVVTQLTEHAGQPAKHFRELGGTTLLFNALQSGEISVYPEYTGTIQQELFAGRQLSWPAIREQLQAEGIVVSPPLGFNNTYALGMLRSRAEALGITKVSDLSNHPGLRFAFGSEFLERADGWRGLQATYRLPQSSVKGMDHDLAYRQLELGSADVIDVYTTDAKIDRYDIAVLEDDRSYFPRYDAVLLYREELANNYPTVVEQILRLADSINAKQMTKMNAAVELEGESEAKVASDFLRTTMDVTVEVVVETRWQRIGRATAEHFNLVRRSLVPAILLAVPLGVIAFKLPRVGQIVLAVVGIVQTIPSLALLVMLMPLVAWLGMASVGVGSSTAVAALLLYSLLPIVRSTHAGLEGIEAGYMETARAIGLPAKARLLRIELPLATGSILAGIKTATVLNIGFATLGALVGAGGYGQPIISGIRLNNTGLILEGAIPAALMAVVAQGAFEVFGYARQSFRGTV